MKKRFYIKAALGLVMTATLFSSCLKDTQRTPDFSQDAPVCDFAIVSVSGTVNTATLAAASSTNQLNALITIGGTHDYTTPTAVTVVVDPTAVPTAAAGTTNAVLPATTYTATSLTVNINPGIQQRIENVQPIVGAPLALPSANEGLITFSINTAALQTLMTANPTTTYYLPLTITSASGNGTIIDQWHTLVYKIAVK